MDTLTRLRHQLHRHPELSSMEESTAETILSFFSGLGADKVVRDLGGTGLAFHFEGAEPGPTVLLRCELDALPIQEKNTFAHRSIHDGVSHKCGHDGHMAILAAVGVELARRRPSAGKVILLYQPAEETGLGAHAVTSDPRFHEDKPDFAFALHNLPGYPLGQVLVRAGGFTAASRGMTISLTGTTAHAAQPETGRSPAKAMCAILELMTELPDDLIPAGELGFVTVVGSRLGDPAFGTAPGHAEVWATLRCESDATMAGLQAYLEKAVASIADAEGLDHEVAYQEEFPATVNDARAVAMVKHAAESGDCVEVQDPFPWSEDFGRFTARCPGALFGLGSGTVMPELHNPDYDFPDALIPIGADLFLGILAQTCRPEEPSA